MTTQLQQQRPALPRASGTSATSSSPTSSLHQSFSNVTLRKKGDRQAAHPQPRLGAPTLLCPHVAEVTRRGKQANLGPPACLPVTGSEVGREAQCRQPQECWPACVHRHQPQPAGERPSVCGTPPWAGFYSPAAVSSIPIPAWLLVGACRGLGPALHGLVLPPPHLLCSPRPLFPQAKDALSKTIRVC